MIQILNWKKANIKVKLDALKIYGFPMLRFGGFLLDESLCSNYIRDKFVVIYNRVLRLTFGFSNKCNIEVMLQQLKFPSA